MIDLDHYFAKRSIWIIILENDRFGSFLSKFPQEMIQIDNFQKKWSKSIIFQKNDPNRSFCEIMFQIEKHLRKWSIWIIVAFGSLIDLEHFPKNDPNPEMIQNRQWLQMRQWSKSMSIEKFFQHRSRPAVRKSFQIILF